MDTSDIPYEITEKNGGIRFHIILFGTRRIFSSAIKYQRERIAYIQSQYVNIMAQHLGYHLKLSIFFLSSIKKHTLS